jgi:hypothetical protein
MTQNSRILIWKPFMLLWVPSISFSLLMSLSKMVLLSARIRPLLRWPGWCLMSIWLLGNIGPKRSTLRAMFPITFSFELSWRRLLMSCDSNDHPR